MGRARKDTGRVGSETYSVKASAPVGASNPSLLPGCRYSALVGWAQPDSQLTGQRSKRRHSLVPVSNAVTVATSAAGAPSLRYCARNGRSTCSRNQREVSLPKRRFPRLLPSSIAWPWYHGPRTNLTMLPFTSLGLIALYTAMAP